MNKLFATMCLAMMAMMAAPWAHAEDFKVLRAKMSTARETLVAMVTDKTKRSADQQKIVKETADAVSELLGKLKAPVGKEAQFKELIETWGAFKKTRETELVPLILAGKDDEALKLAGGIQKDRILKCMSLLGELGG